MLSPRAGAFGLNEQARIRQLSGGFLVGGRFPSVDEEDPLLGGVREGEGLQVEDGRAFGQARCLRDLRDELGDGGEPGLVRSGRRARVS